jgi:hypothetical protein
MNFSRFPRGNMFDMMRREPVQPARDASAYMAPDDTSADGLPSPGISAPSPVLTRPRAGTSIINGTPPVQVGRDLVEDGAADSITLGQLKAHTAGMQVKQKVR